ncbi:hypothetical protein ACHAQH_005420 [Verticillium albo-atrum]
MGSANTLTWLDKLEEQLNVDVDWMDPEYIKGGALTMRALYEKEFARAGINRDRYCIKIPSTGPALNAAKILSSEGIPTLGTALFGLPQAIACSQAGNQEIGKEQPLVKNASFITVQEAMAAGEMGCHSATISHTVINELAKLPYDASKQPGLAVPKPAHVYKDAASVSDRLRKLLSIDSLAGPSWNGKLASTDIDYLANGGEALQHAIEADAVTKKRLSEALALFTGGQDRSQAKVEEVLKLV